MTLLAGHTLAHYRISGAIGAGGMGEVYRATFPAASVTSSIPPAVGPERKLFVLRADPGSSTQIDVVLNWLDELRAKAPAR
jgi:hypothetical protein